MAAVHFRKTPLSAARGMAIRRYGGYNFGLLIRFW
jgi:hypothetical protein